MGSVIEKIINAISYTWIYILAFGAVVGLLVGAVHLNDRSVSKSSVETAAFEDRDCDYFAFQEEAQDFFEEQGDSDPHKLDRDGDGIACETLPSSLEQTRTAKEEENKDSTIWIKGDSLRSAGLTAFDINKDGVDEVIYTPKEASWHGRIYILTLERDNEGNPIFKPFCNNCIFDYYNQMPFVGMSNNIAEIRTINTTEDNKIVKRTYQFVGNDFILKEETIDSKP